ncbi:polyphosphate kinase 1 [Flavihumibacter sp. ZG627]|uniref:polyphosphate kinase 1 n=1 Tax=Flavihumibacter sp. ZG627 TaxID=1463156 RepID=UPI000580952B|nr:polyphosphate kinase 1 [Flavihumibacter sp. ZG627]KIC90062.1 hypothetical protein HY58_13765 [Flavihumibacter sp. ZG627]
MKYFSRDESWLGFNERVLSEATNKDLPLYERIKFLSIYSSNLDEFFSVRYPVIMAARKLPVTLTENDSNAAAQLNQHAMYEKINGQLQNYGQILQEQILPELMEQGIHLYYKESFAPEHIEFIKEKFYAGILSFLRPVFLYKGDVSRFVPENDQLYLIINLKSEQDGSGHLAVVNIPSKDGSRFIELPGLNGMDHIAFIDDVIRENLYCLFPGYCSEGAYSFKLSRNADLELEDEFTGNLLKKLEETISKRKTGMPSRLLYEAAMPEDIRKELRHTFGLKKEEMFPGGRYHSLKHLMDLPDFGKKLKAVSQTPLRSGANWECGNIFDAIRQKDILLHLPYQSYNPVLALFNQAAIHPDTTEIYLTIYRIAANSHIANALISAAQNGKKVTAVVELKARFDEENNISWSKKLKKAGVKIVYSSAAIKVHSKTALIRMRTSTGTQDYCLISTGNFNEITARFYTDHVLLTSKKEIGDELHKLFGYLAGKQKPGTEKPGFKELLVAGFNMVDAFDELISKEIQKAKEGRKALIRIKVNSLEEREMIAKLYKAAAAGVEIQLIVRGICCLVPGQPALQDHIKVKRIVGRYLEHSRIFIFGTDEDAIVYMGSADWMYRNLHKRVEVCANISDPACSKQLIDYFSIQWADNYRAVEIDALNSNVYYPTPDASTNSQTAIYNYLKESQSLA